MTYQSTEELQNLVERYYPGEWYMAGTGTATTDIKNTIETDNIVITLFSLLAVGAIVLITFRSISIPILLLLVIELSIWINMAVPYFQGNDLVFIGYLSHQLHSIRRHHRLCHPNGQPLYGTPYQNGARGRSVGPLQTAGRICHYFRIDFNGGRYR